MRERITSPLLGAQRNAETGTQQLPALLTVQPFAGLFLCARLRSNYDTTGIRIVLAPALTLCKYCSITKKYGGISRLSDVV